MKNDSYYIQIPEPCHEDWNNMQENLQGKHCETCNKSVIDFSSKTDLEINNLLLEKKGENICGHFRKSQLNRPIKIHVDLNKLPKNISTTKSFGIALFLVFGSLLFSCTDIQGQTIGKIEVKTTQTKHYAKGKIKIQSQVTRDDTIRAIDTSSTKIEIESMINGGLRYIAMPLAEDTITKAVMPPVIEAQNTSECFTMGETILTNKETFPTEKESYEFFEENTDLSVYPNPSKGEFFVQYDLSKRCDIILEILDSNGKRIKTLVDIKAQHQGKYTIPFSLLSTPDGIYLVRLLKDETEFFNELIIRK
ncbi:T9SS type A sorting domain-containing protein [Aurantibacillus circumpalustris]|uniref:T9SS type A sorting domain-containing protein n=1 Tax=Aurantibacillus circumpalustris TaxID=3036359 RepID=UPI00295BC3DA|nr:T9SS type A sorting domain-containing protein [Aurantibacillus circumpalustris]